MAATEQLPEPLRGNEPGTFTHYSVTVRLPAIAEMVITENSFQPPQTAAMSGLIDEIADGVITPLAGSGPNQSDWDGYVAPHVGLSWLDVPWFFAEFYFYRRILDGIGYWESGRDPFQMQKHLGLEQAISPTRESLTTVDTAYARGVSTDHLLIDLTDASLWGNQIDLSMWPAEAGGKASTDQQAARLLIDERPVAIRTLRDRIPPPIDFVLDNVGRELLADLVLTDMLIRSDLASRVRLHAKAYPVFVSDAMESDVRETLHRMGADGNAHLRSAGERLLAELATGRVQIVTHPFWVSPLSWRERPADLDAALTEAGMIIMKGDANYRRLLGDRHWDFTTPFPRAIGSTPAPLLALRTLKSEVAAGLEPAAVTAAESIDPEWLQNGRWAVASFVD